MLRWLGAHKKLNLVRNLIRNGNMGPPSFLYALMGPMLSFSIVDSRHMQNAPVKCWGIFKGRSFWDAQNFLKMLVLSEVPFLLFSNKFLQPPTWRVDATLPFPLEPCSHLLTPNLTRWRPLPLPLEPCSICCTLEPRALPPAPSHSIPNAFGQPSLPTHPPKPMHFDALVRLSRTLNYSTCNLRLASLEYRKVSPFVIISS